MEGFIVSNYFLSQFLIHSNKNFKMTETKKLTMAPMIAKIEVVITSSTPTLTIDAKNVPPSTLAFIL